VTTGRRVPRDNPCGPMDARDGHTPLSLRGFADETEVK
jgi:hypothetical protein